MEYLDEIVAEIRNDANRDCVYNHEDLRKLALRLEKAGQVATDRKYQLGSTVFLCGDPNFKAIVISIEETLDGELNYHLVWRDHRGFVNKWMGASEIAAMEGLKEV